MCARGGGVPLRCTKNSWKMIITPLSPVLAPLPPAASSQTPRAIVSGLPRLVHERTHPNCHPASAPRPAPRPAPVPGHVSRLCRQRASTPPLGRQGRARARDRTGGLPSRVEKIPPVGQGQSMLLGGDAAPTPQTPPARGAVAPATCGPQNPPHPAQQPSCTQQARSPLFPPLSLPPSLLPCAPSQHVPSRRLLLPIALRIARAPCIDVWRRRSRRGRAEEEMRRKAEVQCGLFV